MVAQSSYTVIVGPEMTFNPAELTISQGDIVTWISEGGTHDVNFYINSITGESFGNPQDIASASIPAQSVIGEMGSITFNDVGSYNYDCSVGSHAAMGMVGMITVSELFTDCIIPDVQPINTGANMTVIIASDAVSAFPTSSLNPYIVAISSANPELVIGSSSLASSDLIGGQQSITVWGDDSTTPEVDGAVAGEELIFQLVDGSNLYDLNLGFGGDNTYIINSTLPVLTLISAELNCSTSEVNEVGIIEFYPPEGSTYNLDSTEITLPSASLGENYNEAIEIDVPEFLTIELNGDVLDLPINFVQITGVTMPTGMTYSCNVEECYFGPNTSGDITLSGTPTESGINELVLTSVISINAAAIGIPDDVELTIPYTGGNVLLDLQLQGDYSVLNDAIPTFKLNVEIGEQLGCTNPEAINYDANATEDDGSCEFDSELIEFNMGDVEEIISCNAVLYDSGGPTGDYTNNENQQVTIYPENMGEYVFLYFSEFQLESPTWDNMTIYDGEDTNAPILINSVGLTELLEQTIYASPTNESGALTITFTSDASVTYPGWAAEIGCTTYGPCFGFDIDVLTTFETEEGTSDATAEVDITLGNEPFDILWSTGETSESISGLTAGTYFVTISDSEECETETTFDIIVDPEEYLMGEIPVLNTCNGLFYDSGGPNNYIPGEELFIRICPDEDGFLSQLDFTQFDVGFDGPLTIYDGTDISSPVLATGFNTDLLGQVFTASLENTSGCLYISFNSSTWSPGYPGWEAFISCYDYIIYGCMDSDAFNYMEEAEEDDGSCYYAPGCTDDGFVEFYTQGFEADFDNGDCFTVLVDDCTDSLALNYNPNATFNVDNTIDPCINNLEEWMCGMYYKDQRDGYSYPTVSIGEQCWMTENLRYVSPGSSEVQIPAGGFASQLDDGFVYTGIDDYDIDGNGRYYTWSSAAEAVPYAWHLPSAEEFDVLLLQYNGIDLQVDGITGFDAQMSGGAETSSGEIVYVFHGNSSFLWSSTELDQDNSFTIQIVSGTDDVIQNPLPKESGISIRAIFGFPEDAILGCTDDDYVEYNPEANYDDGSCQIIAIDGCTDQTALNYNEIATVDDGSCIAIIEGCTDNAFFEYDITANLDNGSCLIPAVYGCIDDGSSQDGIDDYHYDLDGDELAAYNYDETANLDDGSCIAHILGCTDDYYAEYDPSATLDDNSCELEALFGCTDINAFNYDDEANVDDGSCFPFTEGCTDPNFIEFNGQANIDDGSCVTLVVYGCTIDYALNYDPLANSDDGTCEVEGCTDPIYVEYDINANIDDDSCFVIAIDGCTDPNYLEYFPPANRDDGSCITLIVEGCTDSDYYEYTPLANFDDGSCVTELVFGCTDSNFLEFDPEATFDINNSCLTLIELGCTDNDYLEYNIDANVDNGSCISPIVMGCTNSNYLEYWSYDPLLFSISNLDPIPNTNDGSCTYIIFEGCTDENFVQYNALANVDDNSCEDLIVLGCTDVWAFNYDPTANIDNGLCEEVEVGCMDENYLEFNPIYNTEDNSMCITEVVFGCNDEDASNYNPESNTNDGSCCYYYVEISSVMFADGIVEFISDVCGVGSDYITFWDFGDGFYSNENNPIHTYSENGLMQVVLSVTNGEDVFITSVEIQIANSVIGMDELENNRMVISMQYFDLVGREVRNNHLNNYQVYIQKITYDDGSHVFVKNIKLN
tara:strand:- start:1110 stop:6167 length:5058 start_codon:yes stop_codon:yes gene_type:complete